jgi:hypothetical protein
MCVRRDGLVIPAGRRVIGHKSDNIWREPSPKRVCKRHICPRATISVFFLNRSDGVFTIDAANTREDQMAFGS